MLPRHFRVGSVRRRVGSQHVLSRSNSTSSSTPTPKDVVAQEDKQAQEDVLPFLPRPLGVVDPPSTLRKTWTEKTQELMDQDVRMARRKHIVKEATKGYYSDFHALRKFGGKTWIGPPSLIREQNALYFPDVAGVSLSTREKAHTTDICAGNISVVAMMSTKISEEHVDSFVRPTNDAYLKDPRYRFVQINLQENTLKGFLVSFYLNTLRKTIPPELHSTYLFSTQNMEYEREPLGMTNKHIGFVYLLDQNLKVRWAGGGLARDEESRSLRTCVHVLLNRISRPVASSPPLNQ
ncbi:hypothetical protein BD410DRAFT_199975 [Rickenella mellea]|uniref:F1F0 ATP synthase assembly protein Atp10 n=1 Tax=Rickenella mellea TaxID=50990 RepID=A0A4Y7Q5X9_9AGAM|nr:hypothetical protein BD410DRAFT_199975 [Rickenella mellea]